VVEDAKNLGKAVIASDIPVHREQLENSGHYFHPDKPEQLAELMNVIVNKKETFINYNYEKKKLQFVENLIKIFFNL
jgi:hypothetical protein